MVKGEKIPRAKLSGIAEYVWFLQLLPPKFYFIDLVGNVKKLNEKKER